MASSSSSSSSGGSSKIAKPVLVEEPGATASPVLNGAGVKVLLMHARQCKHVVTPLLNSCRGELLLKGVTRENIHEAEVSVPFELPFAVSCALQSYKELDVVICIGCICKGESTSFEFVAQAVTRALMKLGMKTKTVVVNGVVVCNSLDEANACAGIGETSLRHVNYGIEWAQTAIQMAQLNRKACECECHGAAMKKQKCQCSADCTKCAPGHCDCTDCKCKGCKHPHQSGESGQSHGLKSQTQGAQCGHCSCKA